MKFLGLIDHPSTIVVAQGVLPQCLFRALWVSAKPIAPALGVPFTPLPLDADVVVPGDALLWFHVPVSMGFASLIAPALDAHYIGGVSVSAPLSVVQQMQTQDVWLVLVVHIALTPSAVQSVEVESRLFECVGSHLVLRGFTQSAALVVAPSTAPVPVVLSTGTQTGWGREPGEHRTRDPFACSARGDFQCTPTLVAR